MSEGGVSIPDFVIQEAKEKQFEIEIKALKQYEKEKRAYVNDEKLKVDDYFDKLSKNEETNYRIRRSAYINKARVSKMEARNKAVMKIFSTAQYQIFQKISSDKNFYKQLLKKLMLQGLVSLYEKKIYVRCLEQDQALVQEIIPDVQKEFSDLIKKELEIDFKVELEIQKGSWLQKRQLSDNASTTVAEYTLEQGRADVVPQKDDDKLCFGGVVLTNPEGNIICKSTLDKRIDLCYQELQPELRAILFPSK